MPRLENVHVLDMDRATGRMVVTQVNPTRTHSVLTERGIATYTWQNGHYFGQGGQEIPAELVPQEFKDQIRAVPVTIAEQGPNVIWTCEFCNDSMNRSEKDEHLIAHVRATLAKAGTTEVPKLEE